MAVVLFHASLPGLSGGYVGVDVFFVISGFLITGLLWREVSATGRVRLGSFYGARARRLLPASAAVGVITMIATAIWLPPLQAPAVLGDGIASALYVSNYRFMLEGVDYFNSAGLLVPSPFLHYWSLGVEEQFYLVWAPMILGAAWLIRRSRRRREAADIPSHRPYLVVLSVVAAVSFGLSYLATYVVPAVAFYSLPTRAWQLALGGLVALSVGRWAKLPRRLAAVAGWAGSTLLVLACTWLSPDSPYPGVAALLPTIGTVLIIGAGCAIPTYGAGRLLSLAPMRAIGRISYSWYLWHWPVLIFVPVIVGHPLGLGARLTAAAFAAGLAWLTMRYVENPLRFAPKVRDSAGRSLALGAAATAIAVFVGFSMVEVVPTPVGHGAAAKPLKVTVESVPAGSDIGSYDSAVRQAFAEVQAAVAASADLGPVPSNLDPPLAAASTQETTVYLEGCMRDFFETGQPECVTGDTASTTTVTLVGDSHAAMWNPALRQAAIERGWRLETSAKVGCPLLDLPIKNHVVNGDYTSCEEWRAEMMDRLRDKPPRLVVLGMWRGYGSGIWESGFRSYDAAWIASLNRTVQMLRSNGSQVLVLGPIPDPHTVVPVCLSHHLDDAASCAAVRSIATADARSIEAEAAATEAGGGQHADLTDLFCTEHLCPVIVGNSLVYFDWNHLAAGYSLALAPVIGALADRAMAHGARSALR